MVWCWLSIGSQSSCSMHLSWFFIFRLLDNSISVESQCFIWVIWAFIVDPLLKVKPDDQVDDAFVFFFGFFFLSLYNLKRRTTAVRWMILTGFVLRLLRHLTLCLLVPPAGFTSQPFHIWNKV